MASSWLSFPLCTSFRRVGVSMIDKINFLLPYSLPAISLIRTLAAEMLRYNLSPDDVIDLCDNHYNKIKAGMPGAATQTPGAVCPDCGHALSNGTDKFQGTITKFLWCKSCTYSREIT